MGDAHNPHSSAFLMALAVRDAGLPSPLPRVTELLPAPALSTAQYRGSSALPNADDSSTTLSTGAAWHCHKHTTMPGSSGCFSTLPLPAHGSQRGACHGFIITCKLAGTKGAARTKAC